MEREGAAHATGAIVESLHPLCAALGEPAEPSAVAAMLAWFAPPAWVRACVPAADACALAEAIRILRPRRVLEIGVASGASSAAMLHAMLTHGVDGRLDGFDIHHECYWDRSRAVGSAVAEMVPGMAGRFTLHKGDARLAQEVLPPASIDLAFIDGNHAHPWPTLDLLHLAPLLKPGAWVLLHDVLLDELLREREPGTERRSYGPAVLLAEWPGVKATASGSIDTVRRGTSAANVAAIRVDEPDGLTARGLRRALDQAWEDTPPERLARVAAA